MKLKGIDIYVGDDLGFSFKESFQCVSNLYLKFLNELGIGVFKNVKYLNIELINDVELDSRRHRIQNILEVRKYFDVDKFIDLPDSLDKKNYLGVIVHEAVVELFNYLELDVSGLDDVYKKCKLMEFTNSYLYANKYIRSLDKRYLAGLEIVEDVGIHEIYEILCDKNGNELFRRLCFSDNVSVFKIEYLKWSKDSSYFSYKFKGPQKVFCVNIVDMLEKIPKVISKSSSDFFKL